MTKFIMTELVNVAAVLTCRLGAGGASVAGGNAANLFTDAEVGKFVKMTGDSQYDLCAQGDQIEARISSVEASTQDGYSIGGVVPEDRFAVTFDGLQATPGVGNLSIGDYVVCGTPVAKLTPLSTGGLPARVAKATAAATALIFKYRVVSLGAAKTGAPGTVGVIEQVG